MKCPTCGRLVTGSCDACSGDPVRVAFARGGSISVDELRALTTAPKGRGPRANKFGNVPTWVDGIRFASKREAFMRLHHTVLEGHGHRTSGHCEPDMFGREVFCWSTGCLCGLNPEYARVANKWNWGFAAVDIAADGSFDVLNMRISEDGEVRKS